MAEITTTMPILMPTMMPMMIKTNWSVWQERLLLIRVLVRCNAAVYHCCLSLPHRHRFHHHCHHHRCNATEFIKSSCWSWEEQLAVLRWGVESNLSSSSTDAPRSLLHADLGTLWPLCSQKKLTGWQPGWVTAQEWQFSHHRCRRQWFSCKSQMRVGNI